MRALAFKWIRILFRCWKARQPYQEAIHTAARHTRSPQINPAQTSAPVFHNSSGLQGQGTKSIGELLKSLLATA